MTDRLLFWWHDRTTREQRMLILLAIIAAPLLLWLAVIRPFGQLLDHERLRRDEAERMLADVQAMAVQLDRARGRQIQGLGGPLPAAVRANAEAAGFTVARVDPEGDDGAILVLDAVRSQPFFAWVASAEQRHGLIVTRLTVHPNSDATLAVSASLQRRK